MKKKLLALVCALALTVSLVGCVFSTPDTVGQTTPDPVGDPWSLIPSDDAGLPMPNPGIDPGADITANTGIGI